MSAIASHVGAGDCEGIGPSSGAEKEPGASDEVPPGFYAETSEQVEIVNEQLCVSKWPGARIRWESSCAWARLPIPGLGSPH